MPSAMGSRNYSDNRENRLMSSQILFVCDATKHRNTPEFRHSIHNMRMQGGIVNPGDTILVLGALHRILHPSKSCFCFAIVDIEVKVTAGTSMRKVIIQEVAISKATWVILDRHLRTDSRFYLKRIPCKVALILDNSTVEVLRPYPSNKQIEYVEDKLFYSLSKSVPLQQVYDNENSEQSVISFSYQASINSLESSDMAKNPVLSYASNSEEHRSFLRDDFGSNPKQEKSGRSAYILHADCCLDVRITYCNYRFPPPVIPQLRESILQKFSNVPAMCVTCGLRTELDSMRYSYSELQLATDDFSSANLLGGGGGGGYGHVYLGRLKDGQRIAAKVQREASIIGSTKFHSEVYVLSFARHKNIVMLLGYCCKEDRNILVYEYICNKSLNLHLFEDTEHVLEWHQRYTIAIGIAKGLRFLHEEYRGSPIIHRDVRPSNILLTHDFVPMLGDLGLAKWKRNEDAIHTRILGSRGYLVPEYAENGIVSVRTDVYAFGIVISGRRSIELDRDDQKLSLRKWEFDCISSTSLRTMCTLEKRGDFFFLTLKGDTKKDQEHRLNPPLIASIRAALAEARSQAAAGSVLITQAEGRFFSNGFDLLHAQTVGAAAGSADAARAELLRMVDLFRGVVADLLSLPMPTIAAVTGHAAAAGLVLALSHDYVVMTSSRGVMYMSELDIGMTLPDYFSALVKGKVGSSAARREIALRAAKIGAEAAVRMGIVDEAYDSAEEVAAAVVRTAEELGKRRWSGQAYAGIRKGLYPDVCGLLGLEDEIVMPSN